MKAKMSYIWNEALKKMKEVIEPGISTKELDSIAMKIIKENKAIPCTR